MNYYSAAAQLRKQHSQKTSLANMYHKLYRDGTIVKEIKVELDNNDTVTE